MREKWAERLLAHFAPSAEHIAYMQDILGEDFRKEALDLLGDNRFRTLRQHCLVYESLRKRGFTVIPWHPLSPQPARRRGGHPVQTAPGEEHSSNTVELKAWQTKTVSAARINRNPVPLIAPKYSFTGIPWWTTWVATVRRLVSEEAFQDMDYLLPTVSKDFAGLIPRPSTPERALRWLKMLFSVGE